LAVAVRRRNVIAAAAPRRRLGELVVPTI
jgi:hypothetical protein